MYMKEEALRFANQGIRFNSISPGNVMFNGSTWDEKIHKDKAATLEYIKTNVPLNCFVSPQSIANMVVTIASTPELTGQNIVIDGGQIVGKS
jgi:3-oxoacyl-[acyl-carrier protein] reductase